MFQLEVYDSDGYLIEDDGTKYSTILIYALLDPRTNEIRYIGKTTTPHKRLREHLYARDPRMHVCRWVKSLLRINVVPIMRILEIITNGQWEEREIFWIKWGRENGLRLTNITGGGKGTKNTNRSLETRKLMSEKARGVNHHQFGKPIPEHVKAKIAESHRGSRNHFYGKRHTEEMKRKMSETKMGTPPPNRRAVIVDGVLYESVRAASIAFNVSEATIIGRIRANRSSIEFSGYRYADEPLNESEEKPLLRNRSQYAINRKIASNNKTGYKGVSIDKSSGRFRAAIKVNQKQIHIGTFDTAEEAHEAYKKKAKELFGKYLKPDEPDTV